MMIGLSKLMQQLDVFGHKFNMNYRGEENYKTNLGGLLSLACFILTFVIALKAFTEIELMEDPNVSILSKFLSITQREDIVPVRGDDYNFQFILAYKVQKRSKYEDTSGTSLQIPRGVGTFRMGL